MSWSSDVKSEREDVRGTRGFPLPVSTEPSPGWVKWALRTLSREELVCRKDTGELMLGVLRLRGRSM